MRRSIQDLVLSIDPNVKIEPEVEDVCLFSLFFRYCVAPTHFARLFVPSVCAAPRCLRIAPLGYCRRVYRLGDQFWVQARKAPRGRHVRSQGFTTSSRCVLHISPPLLNVLLSLYQFTAVCSRLLTERNHNIRIPGFASDMPPIALAQAGVTPTSQTAQSAKKGAQGAQNSLRSHRLAQVAQAKREAKLM